MDRRDFMKAGGVVVAGSQVGTAKAALRKPFNLHYAPHFGMFKNSAGDDFLDQLRYAADLGFTAWEDNGMKGRTVETQEAIGKEMDKLGMRMGVFVAHTINWREPDLVSSDAENRARFLSEIEDCVEVAKRVNAKWMTVVPGHIDLGLEHDYQMANLVDNLRMACDILEPHGLVMVLEPLNHWAGHAGQFLAKIPQAYLVCRAVNRPSCKILFDMYHQQIQEGNIIPNIDMSWDEVAYFQIGDNPGRKEPTTGEINYQNIFKHIHAKGFEGILGMEHGNANPGKEGEAALVEAYRYCDTF